MDVKKQAGIKDERERILLEIEAILSQIEKESVGHDTILFSFNLPPKLRELADGLSYEPLAERFFVGIQKVARDYVKLKLYRLRAKVRNSANQKK